MSFESITLQTQEKYDLAKTMQASPCELESWDSATKLCYVLFANIPFIGEYVPSEEQFNDITAAGKELFQRLVKAKYDVNSLNQLEQKELICAAIFLTQKMDALKNSDDGQLWKYILSGLGYDELQSAPSWQSCYKKMTELLRLSVRYFADYGQKYYNTLRIQSLAPADSISELFEIIYSFYKNNLESQYDSSDTAFEILTQNIQKRLSGSDDKDDAQIKFGSGFWALKSSLKFLLTSHFSQDPTERSEMITEFLMDWDKYEIPFHHIVIDEGQDFQDEHLQLLHTIAKGKGGCFYVFYDKNQFIQGLTYAQWLDQMECRLVLSRNCRNTKEIAVTSTRPIGLEESRIKMRREFNNSSVWKPNLFFVDDEPSLQDHLAKLIKKYTSAGIAAKDIVVLSMKPEGKSIIQQSDLRISGKYTLSREPKENSIFFTTVRKFKGLEAEVIICIDIDQDTFSSPKERNVFYVGTSRAMAYLDLLTLSRPEELAAAITGNQEIYSKRPQAIKAVRDNLKVKIASAFDLAEKQVT